jgi:hypothetical protein
MVGYVTLPSNFVALVSANAGDIFSTMAPVAMLIAGVMLGLFAISWVIGILRKPSQQERQTRVELGIDEISDDDYLDDL